MVAPLEYNGEHLVAERSPGGGWHVRCVDNGSLWYFCATENEAGAYIARVKAGQETILRVAR